ncbi:MAG TPA: flavin reductase [Amycolatopsis sp.]|uniref:flavin reductase n=1 Tax=Amycolatopsis sp. TaxID=37632 RepID=UPI002B462251|nr:flavin reductase [Amycolatopsis sp.]HKS45846.1 flavin reductase [Amycolatopsis sp.]
MVRVAIIGAGQSGAQLALGLLRHGCEVSLVSDRTPEAIRTGSVLSSQCMFDSALVTERELGLDQWTAECPGITSFAVAATGESPYAWSAPLAAPAQSVDQRLKCAAWAEQVAAAGGKLVIHAPDVAALDEYARTHDLVVVATGRGDLGRLFPPDPERSPFDRPQRVLALAYVTGMRPRPNDATIGITLIPGVGECLTLPALTTSGPCDVVVFEGIPGGPLDCWDDVTEPEQQLARMLEMLSRFVPAEFERCADVTLTDPGGVLRGRITPQVRVPVAKLPSGRPVLGLGDAVVLNDPLTGQGANLAAHAASYYLDNIVRNPSGDFDEAWMRRTFERFWRGWAQWVVEWTNSMLVVPPPHRAGLLAEAAENPEIAAAIANGFDDPRQFFQWWFDPVAAARFRAEKLAVRQGRFDPRELRRALGQYATGVTVVTARGPDGRKVGMTANSFTSVSMDPPLVLWCPAKNATSLPAFAEATHFAVNVLGADSEHIARQFATPAPDKFTALDLVEGTGGTPVLPDAVAQFECRTVQCIDAGDHVVFLGEVESFRAAGGDPLIFHAGVLRSLPAGAE